MDGHWWVQYGKNVGVKATGFMQLHDKNAMFPHQSSDMWERSSCRMDQGASNQVQGTF